MTRLPPSRPAGRRLAWMSRIACVCVLGLAGAGCASPPAIGWHSLVPLAQNDPAPPVSPQPALAVAGVSLPAEVDRPQLVLRSGANGIRLQEDDRWIEPLKQQMPRALALSLSRHLNAAVVQGAAAGTATARLTVEVQRFELRPGEAAVLQAVWTLRRDATAPLVGRLLWREPAAGPGVDEAVLAMRRAVQRLGADVAQSLTLQGHPG